MSLPPSLLSEVCSIPIGDYGYELPFERIAQRPCEPREAARLLCYDGVALVDRRFYDLPDLLPSGAILVGNDTRVLHARLGMRNATGASIELFLLEPASPYSMETALASRSGCAWRCLVGNAKRWKEGAASLLTSASGMLTAERVARHDNGESTVRFTWDSQVPFAELLLEAGQMPIPPYLRREAVQGDSQWYQTVFARAQGSVAAPTAGLHFSESLLSALGLRGISMQRVTLHVGAGTFLPVKSEHIGDHPMHCEHLHVSVQALQALAEAQGSIIPIGTTSLRTLESLYWLAGQLRHARSFPSQLHVAQWYPYAQHAPMSRREAVETLLRHARLQGLEHIEATTSLLIAPGYKLRMADGLITNFHQPHSTLLLLVAAIVGEAWRGIYQHALRHGYQFLSYGDGMLLLPTQPPCAGGS